MSDILKQTGSLQPKELEAVYAISRSVADSTSAELTLDDVVRHLRPVFIFDNIVLYGINSDGGLEPYYARAIGRGRVREAELAWGESAAQHTLRLKRTTVRIEQLDESLADRTNIRHTLGLPCICKDQIYGVLIFIRFGGPDFLPAQTLLAEFVALHIGQLFHNMKLVERIADLEARRRLDNLQDDFVATITHELLTPLGFIKGYATTLLREDTSWDTKTRQEFLTIIDEEADRLRELLDNLMDSSRLQSGTMSMSMQEMRLDTFVKDIYLRTSTRYSNLQIDLEIKDNGLQIFADPTRLAQVFENIVNNAIKYAPNSPISITLENSDGKAVLSIRDFGAGMSADQTDMIFHRFYRIPTHNTTVRGSGLGLYICKQIIQAHQGDIQAESELGKGSVFKIMLPLINCDQTETVGGKNGDQYSGGG